MKFYPKDMIALVIILAGFLLIWQGYNGWLQGMLALIIGYYFARRESINGIK